MILIPDDFASSGQLYLSFQKSTYWGIIWVTDIFAHGLII